MASLSSCSSNIQIKTGSIDGDVLYKLSMFQNMFRMGKKTGNYTSDELSPHIKGKKKYQRELFLYFGKVVFTG